MKALGAGAGYSQATEKSLQNVDEALVNYELLEALVCHLVSSQQPDSSSSSSSSDASAILVFLPGAPEISRLVRALQVGTPRPLGAAVNMLPEANMRHGVCKSSRDMMLQNSSPLHSLCLRLPAGCAARLAAEHANPVLSLVAPCRGLHSCSVQLKGRLAASFLCTAPSLLTNRCVSAHVHDDFRAWLYFAWWTHFTGVAALHTSLHLHR